MICMITKLKKKYIKNKHNLKTGCKNIYILSVLSNKNDKIYQYSE